MISDGIEQLDEYTVALYLTCPGAFIVDLQSYFEIYEALGVVRTIDTRAGLIAILTTPSMLSECQTVLESLKEQIPWRWSTKPKAELEGKIFNAGKASIDRKE